MIYRVHYKTSTLSVNADSPEDALKQAVINFGLRRVLNLGNAAGFRILSIKVGEKEPDHQPVWNGKPAGPVIPGGYPVIICHQGLKLAHHDSDTEYPEQVTSVVFHLTEIH